MIFFFHLTPPDITEDFDSELRVEFAYQLNRKVPEDKDFLAPANYIQPLQTYTKLTSCLDYDGHFLISADKRLIHVWNVEDQDQNPKCLKGHSELVGKTILHKTLAISSSCDKTVRVWCLHSFSCIKVLRPENRFRNISFPKIAMNNKYLLASSPDHVYMYKVETLRETDRPMRRIQVPELMTDLHIEGRGLAFSCYNAVHIWDFWRVDETNKPFHGTKTRF